MEPASSTHTIFTGFLLVLHQVTCRKATGGNLSVQVEKLNKAGYIEVTKTFKNKRPCTTCKITPEGINAFEEYVEALKSYINK